MRLFEQMGWTLQGQHDDSQSGNAVPECWAHEEQDRVWDLADIDVPEHLIIAAMRHFGGSFAKALAAAYQVADPQNQEKIRSVWPDYWKNYKRLALNASIQ